MNGPRNKQGFTVLELLVASAVSLILIGLFLSVSTNILDAWGESRDSLSSNSKARQILDTMAADLESAILRNDPGVWLACDLLETTENSGRWQTAPRQKPTGASSLQIDFDNENLGAEDYRFGVSGTWIRFFGSPIDASTSGDGGDINTIAYQLIRREPHSQSTEADRSYNLYRSIVRADHTLSEIIEDDGYFVDAFDGASYEGQAGEVIAPRNDSSLFARDVVDLGVVFYQTNRITKQNEILFPLQAGPTSFRVPDDGMPTSADIFVRILDKEGAKQINAFERGLIPNNDPDFWWDTVIRYSTMHSRRVQFKTEGLGES